MRIQSLAIVIPCLNELESIDSTMKEVLSFKQSCIEGKFLEKIEVIVVDDGSKDGSLDILKEKSQRGELRLLETELEKGYGSALKMGLKNHSCSHVCFFDMDQTYPVSAIKPMMLILEKQEVDVVVGTRLSEHSQMPLVRRLGNKMFRLMIRILFARSIEDPCSGMWVFKQELFKKFERHLPAGLNFTLKFSLLVLKHDVSFAEMGINYRERLGSSKLSVITDGFKFFYTILLSRILKSS